MRLPLLMLFTLLLACTPAFSQKQAKNNIHLRKAKETMTPIELNHGETVRYSRSDGQVLTIQLVSTSANILYTNRDKIPRDESGADRGNMYRARLLYEYTCDVNVNGIHMTMRRYVGSQESFFEPYVINGVRIWFIGVTDVFEQHGGFLNTARSANGLPNKNARFVLQDIDKRICPGTLHAWFRDGDDRDENYIYKENFIDIGRTFNGDDCFMGAYLGGESHGALDINLPMNSLMFAPFDLDTQKGIRANGHKRWPDGSEWIIDTGHIIEKYAPDDTPIRGGEAYGLGARRACWWHPHAHFGLQIKEEGILYEIDPWIVFWQHFEDNKRKTHALRAMMAPVKHNRTGEEIIFQCISQYNREATTYLNRYWTFGDGAWADGAQPVHVYSEPGIYPVTITIDDGKELASFTQHITIEGPSSRQPSLILTSPDEPTFRSRPVDAMDVYGWPVNFIPHTMEFLSRPSRPIPNPKKINIQNVGNGEFVAVTYGINYKNNYGWLNIQSEGKGNDQALQVNVDGKGLPAGTYEAIVSVHGHQAVNSPQKFRVVMAIPEHPASSTGVIIDDKDPEFYCTPYFWIGHRFHGWGWPELKNAEGYNNFYLINGMRVRSNEFARFTPDLEAGQYDVWLYERTPFASGPPANNEPARFQVRVVHAEGETIVWMEPEKMAGFYPRPFKNQKGWGWLEPQPTRKIGTFNFEEGNDGFVEILSEGSTGQVIVDAIRFLRMDE